MKKMAASNVLIVGVHGLGVEIGTPAISWIYSSCSRVYAAKNLALAGVKSVTIFDPEPVVVADLASQVDYHTFPSLSRTDISTVFPEGGRCGKAARRGDGSAAGGAQRICARPKSSRQAWAGDHCGLGQRLPGECHTNKYMQ